MEKYKSVREDLFSSYVKKMGGGVNLVYQSGRSSKEMNLGTKRERFPFCLQFLYMCVLLQIYLSVGKGSDKTKIYLFSV